MQNQINTDKQSKEKQEDGKWNLFHPEKFWRTNKWLTVAMFCLLASRIYARNKNNDFLIICMVIAIVTGIIGFIKYIIDYIKRVGWNHFIKGALKEIGAVIAILNTIIIISLICNAQVIWTIIAIIIEIVVIIFIIKVEMNMNSNASKQSAAVSSGVICPKCHMQLAAGTTFCWSCGNKLDAMPKLAVDVPLAGAWNRWGARMLDCTLEAIAVFFVIRMVWDWSNMSFVVVAIISFSVFLLDSAVYAIFKNTLGKWLFGVKIIELSGMPVNAKRYFFRNLLVYLIGFGLVIPIVLLFTFAAQYNRVLNGDPATYDKILHLKSVRGNANGLKTFAGVVLLIILYILLLLDYLHLH